MTSANYQNQNVSSSTQTQSKLAISVTKVESVTLTAGQTFYEGPKDIHTIGRNASKTAPAKLLVVLLKNKNAPILVPVKGEK